MSKGIYKFELGYLFGKYLKEIPMTKEEQKEFEERRIKIKTKIQSYKK